MSVLQQKKKKNSLKQQRVKESQDGTALDEEDESDVLGCSLPIHSVCEPRQ